MSESNEMKALGEQLTNVRLDIRELSTKMDGIKDLTKKVDETHDTAKEAFDAAKSAHLRINRIDKIIFWAGTTIISGIILGGIALLWKGVGD